MRVSRTVILSGFAGAILATAIAVPTTLALSDDPTPAPVPAANCPVDSPSVTGTTPRSPGHGFAATVMPLDDAKKITGNNALEVIDVDDPVSCTRTVLYRSPDLSTMVSVQAYRESDAGIKAAFNEVTQTFKDHAGERYYRNAEVKYWPTGPTHAMPSATYAYTVHTPKYGHDLIYANNGTFTVRIRVGMSVNDVQVRVGHDKLFALAETAIKNSKRFQ